MDKRIAWIWSILEVMFGQRARRSFDNVPGKALQIIPIPLSLMLDLKANFNIRNAIMIKKS